MSRESKKLLIKERSHIALAYRPGGPALKLAVKLASWLKKKQFSVYTLPEQKVIAGTSLIKQSKQLEKLSLVIALGGDGTYLRAARLLAGRTVPILGVNLGSLGFLTGTSAEKLFEMVSEALGGELELEPRAMLEVQVRKNRKTVLSDLALNDVVIERGSLSQLINLVIKTGSTLVSELKADGLIISSPTGSTAYNLAAGGPLLHPEVSALAVTPIAPHSLTSRPLIFPDKIKLSFRLKGDNQRAHMVVDGRKVLDLSSAHEVLISRSRKDHYFVRHPKKDFFVLLRDKLKFGDRA